MSEDHVSYVFGAPVIVCAAMWHDWDLCDIKGSNFKSNVQLDVWHLSGPERRCSLAVADQVYVSGLPDGTTEEDIAQHFGSIGMIKEDRQKGKLKIWLYRDKMTGEMKAGSTWLNPACKVKWWSEMSCIEIKIHQNVHKSVQM